MSPHVKNTRAASDSSVGLSGMVARKEARLQLPGASSSELLLGDRESLRRRRRDIPSAGHARVKKAQMLEEAARLDMRVGCSGERCGAWSHCATANDVWCRRHYCGLLWVLLLPVWPWPCENILLAHLHTPASPSRSLVSVFEADTKRYLVLS